MERFWKKEVVELIKRLGRDAKEIERFLYASSIPAKKRKSFIIHREIKRDTFVIHQNTFAVTIKIHKSGKYKKLGGLERRLKLLIKSSGLISGKGGTKVLKIYKNDIYVVRIVGLGITPADIRSMLRYHGDIQNIKCKSIEIKCFMKAGTLPTEEKLELMGYELFPPPANSKDKPKKYRFITEYNEMALYSYRIVGFYGWPEDSLEINWSGNIDAEEFEPKIIEMLKSFYSCSWVDLSNAVSVSKIKSRRSDCPAGRLLVANRKNNLATKAKDQAFAMIKQRGFIFHDELENLFTYRDTPNHGKKMASAFVLKYKLQSSGDYGIPAWTYPVSN